MIFSINNLEIYSTTISKCFDRNLVCNDRGRDIAGSQCYFFFIYPFAKERQNFGIVTILGIKTKIVTISKCFNRNLFLAFFLAFRFIKIIILLISNKHDWFKKCFVKVSFYALSNILKNLFS